MFPPPKRRNTLYGLFRYFFMKKIIKKVKRPKKRKTIKSLKKERTIMPFDPGFEADMQAVAEKNVYPQGFSVSVEVPPTTPVTVTEKFVAGQPPAVV